MGKASCTTNAEPKVSRHRLRIGALVTLFTWPLVGPSSLSGLAYAAEEFTAANPLTADEIDLIGPVVEYVKAVPRKPWPWPTRGPASSEEHSIIISHSNDATQKAGSLLLVYDGSSNGFFVNWDTARRQRIADFEWPRLQQGSGEQGAFPASMAEEREAMARLVKAITDHDPSATVTVKNQQSSGPGVFDPRIDKSSWGSRRGKNLRVSFETVSSDDDRTQTDLVFDAKTLKAKGGTRTEEWRAGSYLFRKRMSVGSSLPDASEENGRQEVLSFETLNFDDNRYLKIDRNGIYEANSYRERRNALVKINWSLVSPHDPGDTTWNETARLQETVSRFVEKVDSLRIEGEQAKKDAQLERAIRLKTDPAAQPNAQVLELIEDILLRSPSESKILVVGKALHEGVQAPVKAYKGFRGDSQVWIDAVEDDTSVAMKVDRKGTRDRTPWRTIEEVRRQLAKLTKMVGQGGTVEWYDHGNLFGTSKVSGTITPNGKIKVSDRFTSGGPDSVVNDEDVLYDEDLKVIGGKALVQATHGNVTTTTTYRITGGKADHVRETNLTLTEKAPYMGQPYSEVVRVNELKVNKKGIHLVEEVSSRGRPVKWKTLFGRKKGDPPGLGAEGMDVLENFKAGKLPRPTVRPRSKRKR